MNLRTAGNVLLPWVILILSGCSSGYVRHQGKFAGTDDGDVSLPESVVQFMSAKKRTGVDFEIVSYNAATDLMNLGKQALEGRNSGAAVKYLSLGAKLLPYRSDLLYLRNKALKAYVEVTNSMMGMASVPCRTLQERHAFLELTAPDALADLHGERPNCQTAAAPKAVSFDFNRIAQSTLPQTNGAAEKKAYSDLSSDLKYFLAKDREFPFESYLLFALQQMGELEWKVPTLKVSSETASESEVTLVGRIQQHWSGGSSRADGFSSEAFCEGAAALLGFPQGKESVDCIAWNKWSGVSETRIPLGRSAHQGIEAFFPEWLPALPIFTLVANYEDGHTRQYSFTSLWADTPDPQGWHIFLNELPTSLFDNRAGIRFSNAACLTSFLKGDESAQDLFELVRRLQCSDLSESDDSREVRATRYWQISLIQDPTDNYDRGTYLRLTNLKEKDVEGLQSLTVSLDRQRTYDLYRNLWNHRRKDAPQDPRH